MVVTALATHPIDDTAEPATVVAALPIHLINVHMKDEAALADVDAMDFQLRPLIAYHNPS